MAVHRKVNDRAKDRKMYDKKMKDGTEVLGSISMGVILDSSVLVAFERRRFDFERFLGDHSPPAIASITAAELLFGVERAIRRSAHPPRIIPARPVHANSGHSVRPAAGRLSALPTSSGGYINASFRLAVKVPAVRLFGPRCSPEGWQFPACPFREECSCCVLAALLGQVVACFS